MKRVVAVIIFYDDELNVFLQDHGTHSKLGEKYGFWGGGIEEGETSEQALMRELGEELNYVPLEINYWGRFTFSVLSSGETYQGEMFFSPITEELLNTKPKEGSGKIIVPLDQIIENKNNEIGPVTTDFLIKIKRDLQQIVSNP